MTSLVAPIPAYYLPLHEMDAQCNALLVQVRNIEAQIRAAEYTPKHLREQRVKEWTELRAHKVKEYNDLAKKLNAELKARGIPDSHKEQGKPLLPRLMRRAMAKPIPPKP